MAVTLGLANHYWTSKASRQQTGKAESKELLQLLQKKKTKKKPKEQQQNKNPTPKTNKQTNKKTTRNL